MMNHILQVFRYELLRNLRRKAFLFTTFGLPIIAYILFFGYQFISSRNEQDLGQTIAQSDLFKGITQAGYVDQSGLFTDPGSLSSVLTRYDDEQTAQAALNAGEVDVYYIIPQDYLETGDIQAYMPKFSLGKTTSSEDLLQQLVYNHFAQNVNKNLMNRLLSPATFSEINLSRDASGETSSDFGSDFVVVYLFVIIMMVSQFTTNGYLMQTIIEEKETKLIEILISNLRPTQLLTGKILALGTLGLIQIAVWLGAVLLLAQIAGNVGTTLAFLLNISIPAGTVLLFFVYFILGYLFFAAAYGMIGAVSSSMQEGPQFAAVFVLPAVIPLYFLTVFITQPDGGLATALSLFPITAPLSMVMRLTISTVPAWQILLSVVIMLLTDLGMMWLAGRMFRVNTLLAGKTPKLRDIPKLLRG
ncbi:MAG: ABC transporter permease [Anaerolineaceae bacterium]|nr:ABC transporter permease [Anaerolineaceae bacterium]